MRGRMRLMIFHLFVLYFLCALMQFFDTTHVPQKLTGRWETAYPGYENATITITDSAIIFDNGPAFSDTNQILKVTQTTEDGTHCYTIRYRSRDGEKYSLAMYVNIAGDYPVLRLKNQMHILWEKSPDSHMEVQ